MTRADLPVQVGTPINKELFDSKADGLKESVTVYVSKSGSDSSGNGTSSAPYLTIKKAIDSIPKVLNGFHAQIDIGAGTYDERVSIDSFVGGRITLGVSGRTVTVRGVSIMSSNSVRIAISNITYSSSVSGEGAGLYMSYGSNLQIISTLTVNMASSTNYGIAVEHGSVLNTINVPVTVNNCGRAAVMCTYGSTCVLSNIQGSGNTNFGLAATLGGIIAYQVKSITGTSGDYSQHGGRIFSGTG
jgi:pectin methylesterase-like acyl-CoA thioesterase